MLKLKTKKRKSIWIILAIIIGVVSVLSFSTCFNTSKEIDYNEFSCVVSSLSGDDGEINKNKLLESDAEAINNTLGNKYDKIELADVVFDGYVIDFKIICYSLVKRHMHHSVPSSIINNCQAMEATQMSINR